MIQDRGRGRNETGEEHVSTDGGRGGGGGRRRRRRKKEEKEEKKKEEEEEEEKTEAALNLISRLGGTLCTCVRSLGIKVFLCH